jgi:hypothetical protein
MEGEKRMQHEMSGVESMRVVAKERAGGREQDPDHHLGTIGDREHPVQPESILAH